MEQLRFGSKPQPRRAIAEAPAATEPHPHELTAGLRHLVKRGITALVVTGVATAGVGVFTAASANSTGIAFAGQALPSLGSTVSIADLAAARTDQLDADSDAIADTVVSASASERTAELSADATDITKEIDRLNNLAKFIWPTAGSVSSPYGQRLHPILHYYRLHDGDDIGGECGQPVYAAQSGTVVKAEMGYNGGSGNNIRIDHGDINGANVQTGYLHLTDFVVAAGDHVDQGQLVGHVGSTGLSTACHLHFSAYKNGAGTDPMEWIGWNKEAKGN